MASSKKRRLQAVRVKIELTGVMPMLQDCMTEETLVKVLHHGERPPPAKDSSPDAVAYTRIYVGAPDSVHKGKLGVPIESLFACLVGAGRKVKYPGTRGGITSADGATTIPEFLTLENDYLPFIGLEKFDPESFDPDGDEAPPWRVDIRRGQMGGGGGKKGTTVCIIRPKFSAGWKLVATARIELDTPVTLKTVRELFDKAGRTQGLGVFRPSCRGPFGTFRVSGWEVIEEIKMDVSSADEDETPVGATGEEDEGEDDALRPTGT